MQIPLGRGKRFSCLYLSQETALDLLKQLAAHARFVKFCYGGRGIAIAHPFRAQETDMRIYDAEDHGLDDVGCGEAVGGMQHVGIKVDHWGLVFVVFHNLELAVPVCGTRVTLVSRHKRRNLAATQCPEHVRDFLRAHDSRQGGKQPLPSFSVICFQDLNQVVVGEGRQRGLDLFEESQDGGGGTVGFAYGTQEVSPTLPLIRIEAEGISGHPWVPGAGVELFRTADALALSPRTGFVKGECLLDSSVFG